MDEKGNRTRIEEATKNAETTSRGGKVIAYSHRFPHFIEEQRRRWRTLARFAPYPPYPPELEGLIVPHLPLYSHTTTAEIVEWLRLQGLEAGDPSFDTPRTSARLEKMARLGLVTQHQAYYAYALSGPTYSLRVWSADNFLQDFLDLFPPRFHDVLLGMGRMDAEWIEDFLTCLSACPPSTFRGLSDISGLILRAALPPLLGLTRLVSNTTDEARERLRQRLGTDIDISEEERTRMERVRLKLRLVLATVEDEAKPRGVSSPRSSSSTLRKLALATAGIVSASVIHTAFFRGYPALLYPPPPYCKRMTTPRRFYPILAVRELAVSEKGRNGVGEADEVWAFGLPALGSGALNPPPSPTAPFLRQQFLADISLNSLVDLSSPFAATMEAMKSVVPVDSTHESIRKGLLREGIVLGYMQVMGEWLEKEGESLAQLAIRRAERSGWTRERLREDEIALETWEHILRLSPGKECDEDGLRLSPPLVLAASESGEPVCAIENVVHNSLFIIHYRPRKKGSDNESSAKWEQTKAQLVVNGNPVTALQIALGLAGGNTAPPFLSLRDLDDARAALRTKLRMQHPPIVLYRLRSSPQSPVSSSPASSPSPASSSVVTFIITTEVTTEEENPSALRRRVGQLSAYTRLAHPIAQAASSVCTGEEANDRGTEKSIGLVTLDMNALLRPSKKKQRLGTIRIGKSQEQTYELWVRWRRDDVTSHSITSYGVVPEVALVSTELASTEFAGAEDSPDAQGEDWAEGEKSRSRKSSSRRKLSRRKLIARTTLSFLRQSSSSYSEAEDTSIDLDTEAIADVGDVLGLWATLKLLTRLREVIENARSR